MSVVLIPLWVLSGAMFPVQHGWLGVVAAWNPMTYAVDLARHAFGNPVGATSSRSVSLLVLCAFAAAMILLAVRVSRRGGRAE